MGMSLWDRFRRIEKEHVAFFRPYRENDGNIFGGISTVFFEDGSTSKWGYEIDLNLESVKFMALGGLTIDFEDKLERFTGLKSIRFEYEWPRDPRLFGMTFIKELGYTTHSGCGQPYLWWYRDYLAKAETIYDSIRSSDNV